MVDKEKTGKVLVLLGSPRKDGNSAALADMIARGAESAGAQVERVFLHGMKIAPCQSCYACQKPDSKGCAIDDDMQDIFQKLIEHDSWVIASPVYWFNMSAQTKLFMDRCFALPVCTPCLQKDRLFRKKDCHSHELRRHRPFYLRLHKCPSLLSGCLWICGGEDCGHGLRQRNGGR